MPWRPHLGHFLELIFIQEVCRAKVGQSTNRICKIWHNRILVQLSTTIEQALRRNCFHSIEHQIDNSMKDHENAVTPFSTTAIEYI